MEISVTIPVYNVENYLARCLDTVINQTFKLDYEIICVNDGSTDNSGKILEEYAKKCDKIKIYNHKKNRGLSEARNTALKHVSGKYTMFVDADDFIASNALEGLYNYAETHNADVVVFDLLSGIQNHKKFYRHTIPSITQRYGNKPFDMASSEPFVYRFIPVATWLKFYRTDLIKDIKFEKGLINQDVPHWAEVFSKAKRVHYLPVPYYFYLKQREDAITQFKTDKLFDVLKVYTLAKKVLEQAGSFDKYRNIHYAHLASNLVNRLHKIKPEYRKDFVDKIKEYEFDFNYNDFFKEDLFKFEINDMYIIKYVRENKFEDIEKFLHTNNVWK